MTNPSVWRAATCALIALTLAPMSVEATINRVTVTTTRNYENARGYIYAEITVHGSVARADGSVGVYSVPADGHFAGGVRLPHVESTVHGRVAGAPLGRYTPLNPLGLDPFNPFVFISGTFTRFSDDDLLDRYRSRERYAGRVRRAADQLAARGYITHTDRMALIAAAEREPLPEGLGCPK